MELAAGHRFGKYDLLKRIAAGGMGEVYLARQTGPAGFEKIFVLKTILPEYGANARFVDSFLSEARLAALLNHGAIAQVFELGDVGGIYFIAMEFVHGKSLEQISERLQLRSARLEPAHACEIIARVCDGLGYAHAKCEAGGRPLGIVHRDISPQNILVSYDGEVKIIDFGVAKSRLSTLKTDAGAIKGKVQYMAPEQSEGSLDVDRRADLFALGVVLYELVTGVNPFDKGSILQTLGALQRCEVPPASQFRAEAAPFDAILARALKKAPADRYQSAGEMHDALVLLRATLQTPAQNLALLVSDLFAKQREAEDQALVSTRLPGDSEPAADLTHPLHFVVAPLHTAVLANPIAPPRVMTTDALSARARAAAVSSPTLTLEPRPAPRDDPRKWRVAALIGMLALLAFSISRLVPLGRAADAGSARVVPIVVKPLPVAVLPAPEAGMADAGALQTAKIEVATPDAEEREPAVIPARRHAFGALSVIGAGEELRLGRSRRASNAFSLAGETGRVDFALDRIAVRVSWTRLDSAQIRARISTEPPSLVFEDSQSRGRDPLITVGPRAKKIDLRSPKGGDHSILVRLVPRG